MTFPHGCGPLLFPCPFQHCGSWLRWVLSRKAMRFLQATRHWVAAGFPKSPLPLSGGVRSRVSRHHSGAPHHNAAAAAATGA